MKLSTRTRYGIRAILELAECAGKGPLSIKSIAERQDISVKYLEQLLSILRSVGLVRSIRGAKGGYMLAQSADKIKLSNIVNCLEGPLVTAECLQNKELCSRADDCAARQVWARLQEVIAGFLDSITLQDLVERAEAQKKLDYQI